MNLGWCTAGCVLLMKLCVLMLFAERIVVFQGSSYYRLAHRVIVDEMLNAKAY